MDYNIALLPAPSVAARLVRLSERINIACGRLARLGTIAPTTRDPVPRRLPLSIDRRGDLARQTHIIALRTFVACVFMAGQSQSPVWSWWAARSRRSASPPPIAGAAAS